MNRRTISVIRHDGQSIRLRSLTRAAADRDRAVGFLALMQSAYPSDPDGDNLWPEAAEFEPTTVMDVPNERLRLPQ